MEGLWKQGPSLFKGMEIDSEREVKVNYTPMDVIRLKNMVFYGYHGVSDMEKTLGGKFEVDLELFLDVSKAGRSDSLEDTIDYESIYNIVFGIIKNTKFYLVEALAESIAKEILTSFKIESLIVRVRKPHAPIRGVLDTIEIQIERNRSSYV